MPRIYKICVVNQSNESANEVFAIKPYLESFDSFKDEIFIRMPELKNQPLKIYYEDADGDKITIFNALDFGIFQEQKINKVFVVKDVSSVKHVQFQEVPINASSSINPILTATSMPWKDLWEVFYESIKTELQNKSDVVVAVTHHCLIIHNFECLGSSDMSENNTHPEKLPEHWNSNPMAYFLKYKRCEVICHFKANVSEDAISKQMSMHLSFEVQNTPQSIGAISFVLDYFVENTSGNLRRLVPRFQNLLQLIESMIDSAIGAHNNSTSPLPILSNVRISAPQRLSSNSSASSSNRSSLNGYVPSRYSKKNSHNLRKSILLRNLKNMKY